MKGFSMKEFTDPEELFQFVLKDETQPKAYKWTCSICCKKFGSSIAVRDHCESIHFPNMFRYMCQVCDKEMSTKSSLNAHKFYHNKKGVIIFKKVVDDIEEEMKGFSAKEKKKAAFKELVKRTEAQGFSAREKKAAFRELMKRTC